VFNTVKIVFVGTDEMVYVLSPHKLGTPEVSAKSTSRVYIYETFTDMSERARSTNEYWSQLSSIVILNESETSYSRVRGIKYTVSVFVIFTV
jgi:hypothetical protein